MDLGGLLLALWWKSLPRWKTLIIALLVSGGLLAALKLRSILYER